MRSGVRATLTLPHCFQPVASPVSASSVLYSSMPYLLIARHVAVGPHLADQARRVPGGAAGQLALLEQQHVGDAQLGQVVGGGAAGDAAADDDDTGVGGQGHGL